MQRTMTVDEQALLDRWMEIASPFIDLAIEQGITEPRAVMEFATDRVRKVILAALDSDETIRAMSAKCWHIIQADQAEQ